MSRSHGSPIASSIPRSPAWARSPPRADSCCPTSPPGTFSFAGRNLDTNGLRVVLQHKFASDLTATLDYAYGGALDLSRSDVPLQQAQQWISTVRRHALAAKLSGTVPRSHTRWIASYRWVNGPAITPVDMFNASAGQSDPFLNIFIRQPIPALAATWKR